MADSNLRILITAGSVLCGAAIGTFWWIGRDLVMDIIRRVEAADRNDRKRRESLKRASGFYKRAYPLIVVLASALEGRFAGFQRAIADLLAKSDMRFWTPSEYLAAMGVKASFQGIFVFLFLHFVYGSSWVVAGGIGLVAFGLAMVSQYRKLRRLARRRLDQIAIRLPYAVDLISLILDSGGQFFEAVGFVVKEMESHPLAVELGIMHTAVKRGTPRHEALNDLRDRLGLPIVNELVSTMIQGEINGTPMTKVFQNLAEQMRSKRYQMLEAAIARAGVAMSYPGFICMISSGMIILSVFIVPMVKSGFFEIFEVSGS